MYLPRVELQQWRGQTYCPYCIMDIREEEKQREESQGEAARRAHGEGGGPPTPPDETPFGTGQKNPDYECDRCRGDLDIVYVVADHKFCELCFNQQLRNWKRDGIDPPPHMKFRAKNNPGLFAKLIAFLKHKIREEWEKRNKGRGPEQGGKGPS